ncbi:MAG: zinc ribbon domain-containing protein [Deltaproteobacteria bacterium]|nr:zinc ribbon domain-containing protein [Deltaproteobacteria bacterium]
MLSAVMIVLIVGAGYWIVSPLLRAVRPDDASDSRRDEELQQLEVGKEGILATIKELEFDLNMGKISDEDYEELKEQYKNEAVGLIREIDELKTGTKKPVKNIDKKLEREIRSLRKKPGLFCAQCGAPASLDDKFCAKCGERLADPDQG